MRRHGYCNRSLPTGRATLRQAIHAASLLVAFGLCSPALAQGEAQADGVQVFMNAHCFVCHGQQGFGGVGPEFRSDRYLKVTEYVVGQILLGRGIMPSFADKLNDQQIAAVATYIRTSWGNKFGAVKPEEVAQLRKQFLPEESPSGSSQPSPGTPAQAGENQK